MKIKGSATVIYNNGVTLYPDGRQTITEVDNISSIDGDGKIKFDSIGIDNFSYSGNVACISITVKQNVNISGTIRASKIKSGQSVKIIFSTDISVDEISSSKVEIKPINMSRINESSPLFLRIFKSLKERNGINAVFKRIHASEIQLTDCNVDFVICDKIKLSGKCKIKNLICAGDVKIIGNEVQIYSQEKK